jgi:hypothetical protein
MSLQMNESFSKASSLGIELDNEAIMEAQHTKVTAVGHADTSALSALKVELLAHILPSTPDGALIEQLHKPLCQ